MSKTKGNTTPKRRHTGGRPRSGTVVKTRDGRWQAILTLVDGSRYRLEPFPKGTSETMARERAAHYSEKVAEKGLGRATKPSTEMGAWLHAWLSQRAKRYTSAARWNDAHYRHHIAPVLGAKHVRDWDAADLRALVASLDAKIRDGAISWKTAQNIWGTATKMCRDACRSKTESLRCRVDDPSRDVEGPDRGVRKRKQYLYPSEALAVLRCDAVPLRWRRWIALAMYTGLRAGELRALTWNDVDLEHRTIHVHRAWDSSAKNMKATKGMLNRRVPLEACLAPLLLAMKQQADVERVVPELPSECVLATELRRYIRKAGITRRDLLEKSDTFKRLTWHDLRGTHATWCAVRGDSPLTIQQRLGHKSFTTTQGYIVEADARRHGFGEPFPTLPEALSGGGFDHQSITSWPRNCASPERLTNLASPGGFEPPLLA